MSRIQPPVPLHRTLPIATLLLLSAACLSPAARADTPDSTLDSDHDGLSDSLEQSLLIQFAPDFQVARHDCSNIPAEFSRTSATPLVESENGTIYGQVFPAKSSTPAQPLVEIHYYHLWRTDCGPHGHPLDTEHVSALVRPEKSAGESGLESSQWKAIYWYAAAHEATVCDVSQITRAATIHAEDHGPEIWISAGKHASYLNETLCQRGCGADRCDHSAALHPAQLINLGEPGHPMNGSAFIASALWPLAAKMGGTNFPPEPVARLDQLPVTDIAWFNPGRHPAQQIISISNTTQGALADSIATSGHNTSTAISVAASSSGNALQKSYRKTIHALGTSARDVGKALDPSPRPASPAQPQ